MSERSYGNITGIGNVQGDHSSSNVTIGSSKSKELAALVAELKRLLQEVQIPEPARKVILERAVPALEEASSSSHPQEAVKGALERVNDHLEAAGATGEKVAKIAETVKKIAGLVGLGVGAVAPFLSRVFH